MCCGEWLAFVTLMETWRNIIGAAAALSGPIVSGLFSLFAEDARTHSAELALRRSYRLHDKWAERAEN
jgi:hypothetical protein